MKTALITGITGQDGSYLAELLLEKGYSVHGIIRPSSSRLDLIEHLINNPSLKERFFLHPGDLADPSSLKEIIAQLQPDEIYNLGALSQVKDYTDSPEYASDIAAMGTLRLLEAIRIHCPQARFFQATSSELYGNPKESPQTEETPFDPRSLYGISKRYAFEAVAYYRNQYQLFACNGILYNHESPRRREAFVSRKITSGVTRIRAGEQDRLVLGNLDAKRDWGHAKDFVEGMWLMLQQETPEDFILATGQTTTVRTFVELAFYEVGIKIMWQGSSVHEKGIDSSTGKIVVEVSPEFFRPIEDNALVGNPSKAKQKLNWSAKTSLQELVHTMMQPEQDTLCL